MSESQTFWRVQSEQTYAAAFDEAGHLVAQGFLDDQDTIIRQWLTRAGFERSQDFGDITPLPTPYIPVFDNRRDAERRANLLAGVGKPNVNIVKIGVPRLQRYELELGHPLSNDQSIKDGSESQSRILPLRIFIGGGNFNEITKVVSTEDILSLFNVDPDLCQPTQHFFLERVPAELIKSVEGYKSKPKQRRPSVHSI